MGKKDTQQPEADIVTGLTTIGNKEFGAGLLAAAQKENREALQRATVGKVQEVLVALSKQRDYMRQCEKNIAMLQAKVKAFEAGEFTVSTYGVITFNDKELEKGVVRMLECKNCGYGGRRDIDPV